MKILVTGSNGFIGSHLVGLLESRGNDVYGFDSYASEDQVKPSKSTVGDIRDAGATEKALKSMDAVIHLVAAHRDFGVSVSEFDAINIKGTQNLLSGCSRYCVDKFIFYSSVAVYGSQSTPTDEGTTPRPDTPYGRSKLAAEGAVKNWAEADSRRRVTIIRPTVVFGPKNYANVYNLIDKVLRRKFIFVGPGDNIKSVAYVENLVAATLFCLSNLKPGTAVYNYSDEPQMTIKQTVETIARLGGISVPKMTIPLPLATTGTSICDILGRATGYDFPITAARIKKFCTSTHHTAEKIRKEGFRQPVPLNEGFRKTVVWYKEQRRLQW